MDMDRVYDYDPDKSPFLHAFSVATVTEHVLGYYRDEQGHPISGQAWLEKQQTGFWRVFDQTRRGTVETLWVGIQEGDPARTDAYGTYITNLRPSPHSVELTRRWDTQRIAEMKHAKIVAMLHAGVSYDQINRVV